MPITFRHDAAGIPLGKGDGEAKKYGMSLVAQQQKTDAETRQRAETQKYETMQQANMQAFQWQRDRAQDVNRAGMFNAELQNRNKMAEDDRKFQQAEAEARRNQAMMDRAQQQEQGFIIQGIENGEYDQATSRALQQNILAESRAMTAPGLDATQRAAALQKVMDERAKLTALRRDPPPKPTPQPVTYVDDKGREWVQSGKDKWEQIKPQAEPQQGPIDSSVGLQDTKNRDRYLDQAEKMLVDPEDPTKKPSRDQVWAKARELWNTDEYERTRGFIPRNDGPMGPPSPVSTSDIQSSQPALPSGGMATPPSQPQQPPVAAPSGNVASPPYMPEPSATAPAPSPSPSGGVAQPPSGYLPGYEPKPKPGVATGGQGQPVGGQGIYKPTWGDMDPGVIATLPAPAGSRTVDPIIALPAPAGSRAVDPMIALPAPVRTPTAQGYATTDDFVKGRDDQKPAEIVNEPARAGATNQYPGMDYEAVQSFARSQSPGIKKAIEIAMDNTLPSGNRKQAIDFLLTNKVDLRAIGRKPRDPVGGVIPIGNDADRFQSGAYGTWNQGVRGPKY